MANTSSRPATLQPKKLLWADARSLLIVAFVFGTAVGLVGGYFGAINITNDMRRNFVAEQQAIQATTTVKK